MNKDDAPGKSRLISELKDMSPSSSLYTPPENKPSPLASIKAAASSTEEPAGNDRQDFFDHLHTIKVLSRLISAQAAAGIRTTESPENIKDLLHKYQFLTGWISRQISARSGVTVNPYQVKDLTLDILAEAIESRLPFSRKNENGPAHPLKNLQEHLSLVIEHSAIKVELLTNPKSTYNLAETVSLHCSKINADSNLKSTALTHPINPDNRQGIDLIADLASKSTRYLFKLGLERTKVDNDTESRQILYQNALKNATNIVIAHWKKEAASNNPSPRMMESEIALSLKNINNSLRGPQKEPRKQPFLNPWADSQNADTASPAPGNRIANAPPAATPAIEKAVPAISSATTANKKNTTSKTKSHTLRI